MGFGAICEIVWNVRLLEVGVAVGWYVNSVFSMVDGEKSKIPRSLG